jgi:hypothetical protein
MTLSQLFNALLYELVIRLSVRFPSLKNSTWSQLLIANCRPDWMQWKTEFTLRQVDQQAKAIKEKWEEQDAAQKSIIAMEKAQKLFPKAKISLVEGNFPGIMIEHDAPGPLGGPLRIRTMY